MKKTISVLVATFSFLASSILGLFTSVDSNIARAADKKSSKKITDSKKKDSKKAKSMKAKKSKKDKKDKKDKKKKKKKGTRMKKK